jgi:urease accessory protein
MKKKNLLPSLLASAGLLLPSTLFAHPGHGPAMGFEPGFAHPLGGLDHLLALLAVGLWAAQLGGRAFWAVPLSFVSVMALGGILGMQGTALPFVETGIIASVLVLGVLIAAGARLPLAGSMALAGLFALFHGYAHGAEMSESGSGITYAAGFVLATVLLHLGGMGLGLAAEKGARPILVRFAGAAVALAGICFFMA